MKKQQGHMEDGDESSYSDIEKKTITVLYESALLSRLIIGD